MPNDSLIAMFALFMVDEKVGKHLVSLLNFPQKSNIKEENIKVISFQLNGKHNLINTKSHNLSLLNTNFLRIS